MEKKIEDAQVSILLEIEGKVHLVGMTKERLDAITMLIKNAVEVAIPTNKNQKDLYGFLNYNKDFPI
ncbi:hypothetical protein MHI57_18040 [Cytobacillus sp. FSL K6-0129]|uniref:hypothetical protein n=1 Tax=Cytobacillus sp. FSL K6-0129 TaxID=2921421 RepID=UPI0030F7D492